MDKELFYKNQVLKYLMKGDKENEPSEIECYLDELGEDKVFKLFKKYNLKDEKFYLDKFKDLDLSNHFEEYRDTLSLSNEPLDESRIPIKESTITYLEELSTYVFILLNNKEKLRAKEVATFIFKYVVNIITEEGEDDGDIYEFIDFYQELTLTYLEKEAIESGYQEYLIEEGEDYEIFYYLYFYDPVIFTKLLDTLMNDKKELLQNVLNELNDLDIETYEDRDWYSYLLDTIEDLDFLFDVILKRPSTYKLHEFERTMKLIKSKKKYINKEKLKIYKYKTDLFINSVLKYESENAYSLIFKIAFNTFDDEMSYLINEYSFNASNSIYSFIRFNVASDDVFKAFIKPSHRLLLNIKPNFLFDDILSYKENIIFLLEALFDNTDVIDPIFLKGSKEFRRRSETSLDALYEVLLKSVSKAITSARPSDNYDLAEFVYKIYTTTDSEFDMRNDLSKAFPTRKAFLRELKFAFPSREIY